MARFDHTLFVCTHSRDPDRPQGCCAARGGEALLTRLKALVQEHGVQGRVRVVRAGCLDLCRKGCALVAFSAHGPAPETWYTHLTADDAAPLFEAHVVRGERLERLVESKADRSARDKPQQP